MKPLSDCASAKVLDRMTKERLSVSALQLMEKASLRMWDALRPRFPDTHASILALCGKGDNGADALAMLRHAHSAGFDNLTAVVSGNVPGESQAMQTLSLKTIGISLIPWLPEKSDELKAELLSADLVLDGISGTGMKGEAENETAQMIHVLNEVRREKPSLRIASIDLPSGLSDAWRPEWAAVKADLTLALEPVKSICYDPEARMLCGDILPVVDVFPSSLAGKDTGTYLIDGKNLIPGTEIVSGRDYKVSRGRLSIFAGSESSIGAAILCAKAASAAGAGYVTLHVDENIHAEIASTLESFVVKLVDPKNLLPEPCDVVLVGPGWGRGADRVEVLHSILCKGLPTVLDADALRLVAADPSFHTALRDHTVLTPHPGELAALMEATNRQPSCFIRSLMGLASSFHAVVIAKSHVTWIVDSNERASVWDGMLPELGTSGTGDILAGLVAGFAAGSFARKSRLKNAASDVDMLEILYLSAIRAVTVHGLAGRETAAERGWFEAADMLPACSRIARDSSRKGMART